MWRFVAPAGAPVEISDVLHSAVGAALRRGERNGDFGSLAKRMKARHVFGEGSGRSALTVILRSLARIRPGRTMVAIPAYTCFTVPAAIVRAGLKVMPVEIDPETLDFNYQELEKLPAETVLAIVSSNLFGFVNNGQCLRAMARARGAFFVDDAAQAMGASRNGDRAGMMGDVGFYSFGRGKALPAMEGALIVTDSDPIAAAIREEIQELPPGSAVHSAQMLAQMIVYSVFLDSRLYWLPNSLPFLNLGTTEFDPGFPQRRMPGLVRGIIERTLGKLEKFNEIRGKNAEALKDALGESSMFAMPRLSEGSVANYVRFPLIARDAKTRDRAVRELRAAGIGATSFYPSAVCDIKGIREHMASANFHCPAAEDLSRRLLTLPTHPYVTDRDLQIMVNTLRKAGSE